MPGVKTTQQEFEDYWMQIEQMRSEVLNPDKVIPYTPARHPSLTAEGIQQWIDRGGEYDEVLIKELCCKGDYDACVEWFDEEHMLVSLKTPLSKCRKDTRLRRSILTQRIDAMSANEIVKTAQSLIHQLETECGYMERIGYKPRRGGQYEKAVTYKGRRVARVILSHEAYREEEYVIAAITSTREDVFAPTERDVAYKTASAVEAAALVDTQYCRIPMIERDLSPEELESLVLNAREDVEQHHLDIKEWAESEFEPDFVPIGGSTVGTDE